MSNLNIGLRGGLLSTFCIIGLSACLNTDEAEIITNEPAHIDVTIETNTAASVKEVTPESLPKISSSILSVGQREFEVNYVGDFEQFPCRAMETALTSIPNDIDIIVTPNQEDPFEVFRRDTFLKALRKQNLPFIVWEDVPIEDRKKANFSTISEPGIAVFEKHKDKPNKYEAKFQFFKQPMYRDRRGGGLDFLPLSETYRERGESEPPFAQVRIHRLNDLHSLYQVDSRFNDSLLPNSKRGDALYYWNTFQILGPFLMLRHPFENGEADFPIARNLVDNTLLEMLRADQYLYAISLEDQMRYETRRSLSLKITQFNINEFATKDVVATNALLIKQRKRELRQNPLGTPIELCELTLKLK